MDAKVALETAFHVVTQDRKQQCYKYNELKVSLYRREILHVYILGVQLCFRHFPINGFSGKW